MPGVALAGVKVVELATTVAGSFCGKLLADMGADVVKAEPPQGDPARQAGPFPKSGAHPERSALFLYHNTGKRGMTLDPTVPEGLEALRRLVGWADVLIDGPDPERLEELGLGWEVMSELNPALVYTSITPYGRSGPRAGVKGDELTLIHAGGMANLLPIRSRDIERAPVKMGGQAVGGHAGLTAAVATMGALLGQRQTGCGCLVDISLQESILAIVRTNVAGTRYNNAYWSRVPDRPPATGRMPTSDGYIVIGAVEDHHFVAFRDLMDNPEWIAGKQWENMKYRINHQMEVGQLMDEWMMKQSKRDVYHRAAKKGIPVGPVNTAPEVMADEQIAFRKFFTEVDHPEAGKLRYPGVPYQLSATPAGPRGPAPLLGQHSQEICCNELGYSPEEFGQLQRSGAV